MNTSTPTNSSSAGSESDRLTKTSCHTSFGVIDLLNPKADDIHEYDIARTLSRIPLFNGLTGDKGSYSVAQRCVIGADAMYGATKARELALRFLLRYANAAFLGDITRAFQNCFGSDFSERLETITNKWDEVIYQKFGLTSPKSFLESINTISYHKIDFSSPPSFPAPIPPLKNVDLVSETDCLLQQYEYKAFFCKYENEPLISPIGVFDKPAFMPVISPIELFNKPAFTETIRLGLAETWPSVVAEDRFLACLLRYT